MVEQTNSANVEVADLQTTKTDRFIAPAAWDQKMWLDNPIFAELTEIFPLSACTDFPTVPDIEYWRQKLSPALSVQFVENDLLAADGRYYEAFIYHTQQVPTRHPNWHDLFGALIWCLFPQTKKLLNQLHIQEIEQFGSVNRSLLRNKLTLLDECGVLILYHAEQLPVVEALRQHQWLQAFVTHRHLWQGQAEQPAIGAMMFGHANYEMATRPFIGLTGKMLAIAVPDDFFNQPLRQRVDFIDTALSKQIANEDLLRSAGQLTPLPLLGVPGWFCANAQPEFYQNEAYFRPKRAQRV
jgi:hypothetical protein